VEDEQVDAFKRSSSYPCFISLLVGDVLSVGPKVQLSLWGQQYRRLHLHHRLYL
jgi:hypothetical protein